MLLGDEDVAGPAVELQGDLVRHRRRREENGPVLAEQLRDALLQLVHRRVLPHLLVADDGGSDGGAHAGCRAGDGVGAKIDHGCPFCSKQCGEAAQLRGAASASPWASAAGTFGR